MEFISNTDFKILIQIEWLCFGWCLPLADFVTHIFGFVVSYDLNYSTGFSITIKFPDKPQIQH